MKKTKSPHIKKVEKIHGKDCFTKWGKLGGNPALLKRRRQ